MKKGIRVAAILEAKDRVVKLFGYGTYQGEEIPPKEIGGLNIGLPNPKLLLDNGKIIWGCECYWGDEEEFNKRYEGFEIVKVDIDELRKTRVYK